MQMIPPICKLKREAKDIGKLKFPISPNFVQNYNTTRSVNLKKMTDFCTEKNIPFSSEENKFFKVR